MRFMHMARVLGEISRVLSGVNSSESTSQKVMGDKTYTQLKINEHSIMCSRRSQKHHAQLAVDQKRERKMR